MDELWGVSGTENATQESKDGIGGGVCDSSGCSSRDGAEKHLKVSSFYVSHRSCQVVEMDCVEFGLIVALILAITALVAAILDALNNHHILNFL